MIEIEFEFFRAALSEHVNRNGFLLLLYQSVSFALVGRVQILPGQFAFEEVNENIPKRFHVISARKLFSLMRVQRCIARSSCETLASGKLDMFIFFNIPPSFCQAHVNEVKGK